jgi:hypothetical protein
MQRHASSLGIVQAERSDPGVELIQGNMSLEASQALLPKIRTLLEGDVVTHEVR